MIRNWENNILEWAEEIDGQPFEWGVNDCLTTALTAGEMIFGEAVVELDPWDAPESLVSVVQGAGGVDVLLSSACRRIGVSRLRTGDLVYFPDACPETELGTLAVVVRDRMLVASVEDGVTLMPLRRDGQGWRFVNACR